MNAYRRWASLVVRTLDAERDPRTLVEWGRYLGASASTLRSRCAAVGQGAKASLDFARLLRLVAVSQAAGNRWDPAAELASCDPRTVQGLLIQAGLHHIPSGSPPPSITYFLRHQHVVSGDRILTDLTEALADHGVPVEPQDH